MRRFKLLMSWIVAGVVLSAAPGQTTWYVDDDATPPGNGSAAQPLFEIAPAIAVAQSGDLVLVADGLYTGFDFSGKDVAVRSVNGPATTTLGIPAPSGLPPLILGTGGVSYCNLDGFFAGVGNFNATESFVNAPARDYRLTQFSPSVNAGNPAVSGVGAPDFDGEPRVFGGRLDVGADEHTGPLVDLSAAAGTVGDATGGNGPFDILRINGTAGYSGRTVEAALGAPLAFDLAAPPGVAGPFSYALCGMFGVPNASAAFATPFGPFLFLPAPVDPQAAGLFLLASDVDFPAPALVPTGPAPLTVTVPAGLSFPLTITLQAAVVAGGPTSTDLRVSNGVVLRVY